ncbi:MAG: glutamyl-tRNA reductase [Candidatus Cloacimonadota bacterium]|nr:MAG: glutamyl-tRNA reductase [Candidatus Cloacimonadota bacterium]
MIYCMIGMNHHSGGIDKLDSLFFTEERKNQFVSAIEDIYSEVVVIQTCNRLECYLVSLEDSAEELKKRFIGLFDLTKKEFDEWFYLKKNNDCIRHLLEVVSSLDSVIIGENQILSQVRNSYLSAKELGWTDKYLNRLFELAVRVGKRVRTETSISRGAVSISQASVELAKKVFGDLYEKKALILGAGEMGRLALKHLVDAGIKKSYLMNRTLSKAQNIAQTIDTCPLSLDKLEECILEVDVVISAVSAPDFIVKEEHISGLMKKRKYEPLFFIDISMPRTLDPKLADHQGVFLFDIEDLKSVVHQNIEERNAQKSSIYEIIAEEMKLLSQWKSEQSLIPLIKDIEQWKTKIVQKEIEKSIHKILNADDCNKEELIKRLAGSIASKCTHLPLKLLKGISPQSYESKQMQELTKDIIRVK